MSKYVISLIVLFSSSIHAAGWYDVGKVTRVHSGHGDSVMYFSTESQVSNPLCSYNIGYTFSANESNTNRIYSLLMSAYISKTPVSIFVTDACILQRPQVNAIQLKDQGVAY